MQISPQLTPLIAVHMTAAILAIATGPVALWARKGRAQRPRLHRAFGYAWVTLMLVTAVSAIFISGDHGHYLAAAGLKFSWSHLLIPVTLGMLTVAFWFLFKGNVRGHKLTMQNLYLGACVVAGAFALMPGRYLGELVLYKWLGLA